MEIPKSIKIGGHDVEILLTDDVSMNKSGELRNWKNLIKINNDGFSESVQAESLMHEILEAINENHQLELPHHVIMTLADQIFAIIRNNNLDFSLKVCKTKT